MTDFGRNDRYKLVLHVRATTVTRTCDYSNTRV